MQNKNIIISVIACTIVIPALVFVGFILGVWWQQQNVLSQNQFGQQQTADEKKLADIVAKKDIGGCSGLADVDQQAQCKDSIAVALSQDNGDASQCEKSSSDSIKKGCIFNYWNSKAIKDKNPAVCDNIAEQMNKDLCKENVQAAK